MKPDGMIERLQSTAERCRHHAATASDPEVAQTLVRIAEEMEAVLPTLQMDSDRRVGATH
jgi:hypothetical protein